jgi:hypothetical protein
VTTNARAGRSRPLVVTISSMPIFHAAVVCSLDDWATVQSLRPAGGDTSAVLRVIAPDAVIVDNHHDAQVAAAAAAEQGFRIVHVARDEPVLRVLGRRGWSELGLPSMGSDAFGDILRTAAFEAW